VSKTYQSTIIKLNRRYPDTRIVTAGDSFAYRGQRAVEQVRARIETRVEEAVTRSVSVAAIVA